MECIEQDIEHEDTHHHENHISDFIIVGLTAGLLIANWTGWLPEILGVNTALLAALVGGFPIVREAFMAILQRGDTKVGLLVSIAIIASIVIGEYFAAAEVALIMTIGELLEHITVEKSNTSLQKLAELAPLKARIIDENGEREAAAASVRVGDYLLVKPGEKIPADGVVLDGYATVDQSMITGESMPVERREGSAVFGGTLVQMGSVKMVTTKVGKETALGHIIQMVEQAQQSKAPIARIVDRWANWFVPLSLGFALLVYGWTGDIVRAVTILIVFCPCAMLLSTPTAVAAAIGTAARRGILIKGGEVLERAGQIDTVVFDKTGTVTSGQPILKELRCYDNWEKLQVLALVAGIEQKSEHHLAKAILGAAISENVAAEEPDQWEQAVGKGIIAQRAGNEYLVGNRELLEMYGIQPTGEQGKYAADWQAQAGTTVYFTVNGSIAAIIVISDPIRSGAAEAIVKLKDIGVKDIVLLTGDRIAVGQTVGAQIGINSVFGDLLPRDKVTKIEQYQQQGKRVAMVGDGINDAPALAKAHLGIAMGCGGTDVAIEAADVALLSDDLDKIPGIISLSKRAVRTIRGNIVIANSINILALGLAAYGLLGPVAAAIVHNAGAIIVVLNSARLLKN